MDKVEDQGVGKVDDECAGGEVDAEYWADDEGDGEDGGGQEVEKGFVDLLHCC